MDALWIIIFVIAMIFKALNKGQQTGGGHRPKKDQDHWWEQPQSEGRPESEAEVSWQGQEWGGWDEFGNWQQRESPPIPVETKQPDLAKSKPVLTKKEAPEHEPPKKENSFFERAALMPEREPARSFRPDVVTVQEERGRDNPSFLEINQGALVNAVIMSEILQPPVSKRKQKIRF